MSMNLYARSGTEEIELWQTPTQITYTILPRALATTVSGTEAKHALLRYMEWVRYSINGVWDSAEELENYREDVREHLEYISAYLDDEDLCVFVR